MVTIAKFIDNEFMECLQTMLMHKTMYEFANDYYQIINLAKRHDSKFTYEFFTEMFSKIHKLIMQQQSGSTDIIEVVRLFEDRPDLLQQLATEDIKK